MKLGLGLAYAIGGVIILAVFIHLWPDMQPLIQNIKAPMPNLLP